MSTDGQWSVTAEVGVDASGPCILLKIGCMLFEANIWIPSQDLARLSEVHEASWPGGSIRIGSSAGSPAFWSSGKDEPITVLIGVDDEAWDVGLTLPQEVFEMVLSKTKPFLT